jgi:hypothetical protein
MFKKAWMTKKLFLALFIGSIIGVISYVWYYLHNPPVAKNHLENFKVIKSVALKKYTKQDRDKTNKDFHKMWMKLPSEKQQQMIKNLEHKEIKGFRQGL